MIYTTTATVVSRLWQSDKYVAVEVKVNGFKRGDKVTVFVFSEDQKKPILDGHGVPRELWELEEVLSNVSAYAMGPILNSQESLAQRVTQIKEKVRGMIREYGYVGPF